MYKKSIRDNSKFLVPFMQGIKFYGSDKIESSIGTMIILNDNGDFLTCKHIAREFIVAENLKRDYSSLLEKINKLDSNEKKKFEKENKIDKNTIVLSKVYFLFDIDNGCGIKIIFHDKLDLAFIHVEGLSIKCESYPVFSTLLPEPGQSICRIGYAFPGFDLFKYDKNLHDIIIKKDGIINTPIFPLDGIVTRYFDIDGNLSMIETSSPGLRGQSGGPIFGPDGLIYGIQSMTSHMDLNFDVHKMVKRGISKKEVDFTPFLNLGVGVASTEVIKFLDGLNVSFNKK